ncbi:PrsW family intramembrane metalloprotease [Candidatus Azambacteria bacterium]|nr:PrsW family intramembrane metalloprotease [Candidatus Azambacteria bacterium]
MLESIQYFSMLVFLGFIPSLIWLSYYLYKDGHNEPKKVLMQVFFLGALSTLWALFFEAVFLRLLRDFGIECKDCDGAIPDFLSSADFKILSTVSFLIFFGLAFIEEFTKYLIVKARIIKEKTFDEPVDAMIYLVVGALGFAAAENIGYIITSDPSDILNVLYFRFFTATFLHAMASAIVGYFLALSIIHKKNHFLFISFGLVVATISHAMFNILVSLLEDSSLAILYLMVLLIFLFHFVSYLFERIKKIHYHMRSQDQ